MMSFPGAKRSTQRPKLVPKVPRVTGWSWAFVAPTVMTWNSKEVRSRDRREPQWDRQVLLWTSQLQFPLWPTETPSPVRVPSGNSGISPSPGLPNIFKTPFPDSLWSPCSKVEIE